MFPLPHLLILLNTNETRLRPSKGGRPGQGYAIDATAHIPQDRGGADMRDVQCQPTSLGGAGSGVGDFDGARSFRVKWKVNPGQDL